jgi:hypothetical protein
MSACDFEIGENMTIEDIRAEYAKITSLYQRIKRNGDNVYVKVGRKPVSEEHKAQVYKAWLERRKVKRAEQAVSEGRVYARGRPKKISMTQTAENNVV